MAHPNSDLPPSAADSHRRLLAAEALPPLAPPNLDATGEGSADDFEATIPWAPDEDLRREFARLEAGHSVPAVESLHAANGVGNGLAAPAYAASPPVPPYPELDPMAGGNHASWSGGLPAVPPAYGRANGAAAGVPRPGVPAAAGDVEQLRAENEEMHKLIEEMKQVFEQASVQEEAARREVEAQREQAAVMEQKLQEKDEQIQLLTAQIHELEQHVQQAHEAPPSEDELSKMADELEKERCTLTQERRDVDQERQQLREDEDAMMKQMREMEVSMAKERAEMARQRTELQRLHAEIRHELDQAQRGDGALKDRLSQFQRRHQEVFSRTNGGPAPAASAPAEDAPPAAPRAGKESGLLRRFFKG
jgi:hypothetical protein